MVCTLYYMVNMETESNGFIPQLRTVKNVFYGNHGFKNWRYHPANTSIR